MDNINEARNFLITMFGKQYIVKKYQLIIVRGIQYIFLGAFKTDDEVPNVTCCYIIGNRIKTRLVQRPHVSKKPIQKQQVEEFEDSFSDNQLLKICIDKEDDELMVLMKSILMAKRVTVGQFKRLYGEANKTDMNNDKSRLENKHTLSWNKFVYILKLLDLEYKLFILDN